MEALNPVFLRLLVTVCDYSKARAAELGLEIAPEFTLEPDVFEQESQVYLAAIRDLEGARAFGVFVRREFGPNVRDYMLCAQNAAMVYDPELNESMDFDDAYEEGWKEAHQECLAIAQQEKTQSFIAAIQQLALAVSDEISVVLPEGSRDGVVLYIHPCQHAVVVEFPAGEQEQYPRVLMLGAYHDVFPLSRRQQQTQNDVDKYQIRSGHNGELITKDGHTMFLEDAVKELNRLFFLEQKQAGKLSEDPLSPMYALRKANNGHVITKDGHVMFLVDAVKHLNRLDSLEKSLLSSD